MSRLDPALSDLVVVLLLPLVGNRPRLQASLALPNAARAIAVAARPDRQADRRPKNIGKRVAARLVAIHVDADAGVVDARGGEHLPGSVVEEAHVGGHVHVGRLADHVVGQRSAARRRFAGPVSVRSSKSSSASAIGARERAGVGRVLRLAAADPHHAVVHDEHRERDEHEKRDRDLDQDGAAFRSQTGDRCMGSLQPCRVLRRTSYVVARWPGRRPRRRRPRAASPMSSPGGRNRPGSVGSGGTSSGLSGRTRRGVMRTSSSVRSLRSALLLNKLPMIGIWLRIGTRRDVGLRLVVDQAGNGERLAVAQLHFGFGAARR